MCLVPSGFELLVIMKSRLFLRTWIGFGFVLDANKRKVETLEDLFLKL